MPDIYSRFTSESLFVMRRARERINESKRRQILPEDLLASMLEMNRCDANQLLAKKGVAKRQLQNHLDTKYEEWSSYHEPNEQSTVRSYMSTIVRKIIDAALLQAAHDQAFSLSTRHLLIGLLEQSDGIAKKALNENGITVDVARDVSIPTIERSGDNPDQIVTGNPFRVSPIFLLVVLLTAVAGYASYTHLVENGIFVFLFVLGGWIISLALHEFGHAVVAYRSGDRSVANKGYLSLNPLKYTHPFLSILLPLLIIVIGGIGLPGGAVYIDRNAIRDERMHSWVAAAGPIATFLCAMLLAIPFLFGFVTYESVENVQFWGGVAMLLLFQITALFINLIPLPGLDGFNIIARFLSVERRTMLQSMSGLSFFVLYFALFQESPIQDGFWGLVFGATDLLSVDRWWIGQGYELFHFWWGL